MLWFTVVVRQFFLAQMELQIEGTYTFQWDFYFLKRIYKFLILILYIKINMFNKYQCFYMPNRELSYDCTDGGVLIYSNRYNRISFESNNLKNIGTLFFFVFRFHLNTLTEMGWN